MNEQRQYLKGEIRKLLLQQLEDAATQGGNGIDIAPSKTRLEAQSVSVSNPNDALMTVNANSTGRDLDVAKWLSARGYNRTLGTYIEETEMVGPMNVHHQSMSGNDATGNFTLENLVVEAWDKMERRYKQRLNEEMLKWTGMQRNQLHRLENKIENQSKESLESVSQQYHNQLIELRNKEQTMWKHIESFVKDHNKELSHQRNEVITQFNDLDRLKQDLNRAEDTFIEHETRERTKLRLAQQQVQTSTLELKQRSSAFEEEVQRRIGIALREQQTKHLKKLEEFLEKENALKERIKAIKSQNLSLLRMESDMIEKTEEIASLKKSLSAADEEIQRLRGKFKVSEHYAEQYTHSGELHIQMERLKTELFEERQRNEAEKRAFEAKLNELKSESINASTMAERFSTEMDAIRQRHKEEITVAAAGGMESRQNTDKESWKQRHASNIRPIERSSSSTINSRSVNGASVKDSVVSNGQVFHARRRMEALDELVEDFQRQYSSFQKETTNMSTKPALHNTLFPFKADTNFQHTDVNATIEGRLQQNDAMMDLADPILNPCIAYRLPHRANVEQFSEIPQIPSSVQDKDPGILSKLRESKAVNAKSISDDEKVRKAMKRQRKVEKTRSDSRSSEARDVIKIPDESGSMSPSSHSTDTSHGSDPNHNRPSLPVHADNLPGPSSVIPSAPPIESQSSIVQQQPSIEPDIDPMVQQYMNMVLQQRTNTDQTPKGAIANNVAMRNDRTPSSPDENVEIASVKQDSAEDDFW